MKIAFNVENQDTEELSAQLSSRGPVVPDKNANNFAIKMIFNMAFGRKLTA